MDHSASSFPENGLMDCDSAVDAAIEGGADAIVLHKGPVSYHFARTSWGRFVCHSSMSTIHGGTRSQEKITVSNARECLSRGAIGISGQVNLGDSAEPEMILRMSNITSEALEAELPVLGMFYPRGPNLRHDPSDSTMGVAHAARLAWELGCNVVKVPWTGSEASFRIVTSSVPIPVLISGKRRPILRGPRTCRAVDQCWRFRGMHWQAHIRCRRPSFPHQITESDSARWGFCRRGSKTSEVNGCRFGPYPTMKNSPIGT